MESNWQYNKSIKEAIYHLFEKQIGVDVTFKVKNETIKGHKVILGARSPKLERLFENRLFSTDLDLEMDGTNIIVNSVEPDIFRQFMRYIYGDLVELTDENAIPLLVLAQRFDIPSMEELCAEKLEHAITPENLFSFANQASSLGASHLISKCVKVFSENTKACIKNDKFLTLIKDALSALLDAPVIECSELDLFKAVCTWSEAECRRWKVEPTPENKRKVVGEAIYKLRLPTINLWEFSKYVALSGLISGDDLAALYIILTVPATERNNITTRFPDTARDVNSDNRTIAHLKNYMIIRSALKNVDATFYSVRGTPGTEHISSEKTTVLFKKASQFNMAMFFAV